MRGGDLRGHHENVRRRKSGQSFADDEKGTVHTDLYDGGDKNWIPFDKLESFYTEYLK